MIDHTRLKSLVNTLYETVHALEQMFPGRHFTPDGHMVGSLGECLVADAYDLTLQTASNRGYDALTRGGVKVEIKATQANAVAFRSAPEHAIVIRLQRDGSFEEIFNGPGALVWAQFDGKPLPSNGQYQISLAKLRQLNAEVPKRQQIPRTS